MKSMLVELGLASSGEVFHLTTWVGKDAASGVQRPLRGGRRGDFRDAI